MQRGQGLHPIASGPGGGRDTELSPLLLAMDGFSEHPLRHPYERPVPTRCDSQVRVVGTEPAVGYR